MALRCLAAATLAGLASLASALYTNGSVTAPCDSPLYCQGEIIKAIELARPFADSKTFVDMQVTPARSHGMGPSPARDITSC